MNEFAARPGLKGNKLDMLIFFAVVGCLLSASMTYLFMDYRRHGERELDMKKVFKVQQELAKINKALAGYTSYQELLPTAKLAAIDKMRSLMVKVVRDQMHIEVLAKDATRSEAIFAVKYFTEYLFYFELKPDSFDLLGIPGGIQIRLSRPRLYGAPFIKNFSSERLSRDALEGEKEVVRKITDKLPGLVQEHGIALESDEAIRALCEKRLLEFVTSFLATQEGVTQVPVITIAYK